MGKSALVLGGGFAGLEAAIQLKKHGLEVTLVSDRSFLWIYPTSIWVPTGEYSFEKSCLDLDEVAQSHGFTFVEGEVEAVDGARRTARVSGKEISADHLVVAIGGIPLKPKGVEHTFTISARPESTQKLKEALDALIEKGEGRIAMGFGGNPKDPTSVRGGPAFELMFNVDTMLRRKGIRDKFELTFFAPMASPGQRMGKRAVAAVGQMFERLGIQTRYGKKITGFEPGGTVLFEDGSKLESDLTMFIAAGQGHPVLVASDLPKNEAGFVKTDDGCAVEGMPGVWAIGDSAALLGPEWRAKQGHMAEVMAKVATSNIAAVEAGKSERESYLPHVNIICLMDMGNGAAYVKRDDEHEKMVAMPVYGHWAKKAWGSYYKLSKLGRVPRLPGM
jgi:sulfide:quinone oxidoreductase